MTFFGLLDPLVIIKTLGLLGVVFTVFAESGLFFGFFLPGDSLLFTAGILSSQDILSFWPLLLLCFVAAVFGDSAGYYFGKKTGPMIFTRSDSFFFKKRYLEQAKTFYERHGKKTIILARFVPMVRTFAPIFAGIAGMDYKVFIKYNIIGAFLWTSGLIILGFFLGRTVPNIDKYLLPIILTIILLSMIPAVVEFFKNKRVL